MDNSQDMIDSRDVIARIEELQGERDEYNEKMGDPNAWASIDDGDPDELRALLALAEEGAGYAADWHHGEQLIRDSYFETYAQELAEECGMIPDNLAWPMTCIDWEQAARELQYDYTGVDFDGVTYWIR